MPGKIPVAALCTAICFTLLASTICAQPYGIDERTTNTTLLIDPLNPPAKLSDHPALYNVATGGQEPGVIPYAPQVSFWSDGAIKTRYLALPGMSQITYQPTAGWDFPNQTVMIKNFSMPLIDGDESSAVRVETRLMIKDGSEWRGYSYKWREDETDADLLPGGSAREFTVQTGDGPVTFSYEFPQRSTCFRCHTDVANGTLGFQTLQMNSDFNYPGSGVTDNQLRTFEHLGLFDAPLPAEHAALPSLPKLDDSGADLNSLVKSYFHVNCSMCHQPGGPAPALFDMRWDTVLNDMGLINGEPIRGNLGVIGSKIVKAGEPDSSVLYLRVTDLELDRMPPLATHRIDVESVEMIRNWILSVNATAATHWLEYE